MSSCSKHSHHHDTVIITTSFTILGRILLLTFSYNTDVRLIFLFSLNLFFSPTFSIAEVNCWFIYIQLTLVISNSMGPWKKFESTVVRLKRSYEDTESVVCLTTKGRQLERNFEELKPASHVPILGTILNIFDVFVAVFFSPLNSLNLVKRLITSRYLFLCEWICLSVLFMFFTCCIVIKLHPSWCIFLCAILFIYNKWCVFIIQ